MKEYAVGGLNTSVQTYVQKWSDISADLLKNFLIFGDSLNMTEKLQMNMLLNIFRMKLTFERILLYCAS